MSWMSFIYGFLTLGFVVVSSVPFHPKNDIFSLLEEEINCYDVLSNDWGDVDASTLKVISASEGGITDVVDGELCYTPAVDFTGDEEIIYEVCEQGNPTNCDTASVIFKVQNVNDAPVAVTDYAEVNEWQFTISIPVLENDYDVDSHLLISSLSLKSLPRHGTAWVDRSNALIWYQPFGRFRGQDSFTYSICDAEPLSVQECSWGTVNIEVQDKCFACQNCGRYLPTYAFHTQRVEAVFDSYL